MYKQNRLFVLVNYIKIKFTEIGQSTSVVGKKPNGTMRSLPVP